MEVELVMSKVHASGGSITLLTATIMITHKKAYLSIPSYDKATTTTTDVLLRKQTLEHIVHQTDIQKHTACNTGLYHTDLIDATSTLSSIITKFTKLLLL